MPIGDTGHNLFLNVSDWIALLSELKPGYLIPEPILQVYCNRFPRPEYRRIDIQYLMGDEQDPPLVEFWPETLLILDLPHREILG